MGAKTKIQLIKRLNGEQWNVNLPVALAKSLQFTKGELVEWIIQDRTTLILKREMKETRIKSSGDELTKDDYSIIK